MTTNSPDCNDASAPDLSPARLVVEAFRKDALIATFKDEQGLSFDFSTYEKKPDVLTLDHIGIEEPFRGRRTASKALKLLTELADVHGVQIDLDVGADESEIGLVDWYARHGFKWSDDKDMMVRNCQLQVGYHVTTELSLDSILRGGLIPNVGPRSQDLGETEPRIYFFSSKEDVENALSNWLGEQFDEDENIYVLEVNLSGIETQRECGQFEVTAACAIEADRILNIYDENMRQQKKNSSSP